MNYNNNGKPIIKTKYILALSIIFLLLMGFLIFKGGK
ncbi:hypothetical protein GGQ60_001700 [Pedobacter zeae]|uniref:Uncharacterized protein n=1 Tax=Pedobacter zeae TaxID=1737356 RepID=A0A7W6P4L9_9SPHI|nr:hypothetical protein [Pedobacter zeae]